MSKFPNESSHQDILSFPLPIKDKGVRFKIQLSYGLFFKKMKKTKEILFASILLAPNQQKIFKVKPHIHQQSVPFPSRPFSVPKCKSIPDIFECFERTIVNHARDFNSKAKMELIPEGSFSHDGSMQESIRNQSELEFMHCDFYQQQIVYRLRLVFFEWKIIAECNGKTVLQISDIHNYDSLKYIISPHAYRVIMQWIHQYKPNMYYPILGERMIPILVPTYYVKHRMSHVSDPLLAQFRINVEERVNRKLEAERLELENEFQRMVRNLKRDSTE